MRQHARGFCGAPIREQKANDLLARDFDEANHATQASRAKNEEKGDCAKRSRDVCCGRPLNKRVCAA
jgi:hypothetical protein